MHHTETLIDCTNVARQIWHEEQKAHCYKPAWTSKELMASPQASKYRVLQAPGQQENLQIWTYAVYAINTGYILSFLISNIFLHASRFLCGLQFGSENMYIYIERERERERISIIETRANFSSALGRRLNLRRHHLQVIQSWTDHLDASPHLNIQTCCRSYMVICEMDVGSKSEKPWQAETKESFRFK